MAIQPKGGGDPIWREPLYDYQRGRAVTKSVTKPPSIVTGVTKAYGGRPREHATDAERQRAYRLRKKARQ